MNQPSACWNMSVLFSIARSKLYVKAKTCQFQDINHILKLMYFVHFWGCSDSLSCGKVNHHHYRSCASFRNLRRKQDPLLRFNPRETLPQCCHCCVKPQPQCVQLFQITMTVLHIIRRSKRKKWCLIYNYRNISLFSFSEQIPPFSWHSMNMAA